MPIKWCWTNAGHWHKLMWWNWNKYRASAEADVVCPTICQSIALAYVMVLDQMAVVGLCSGIGLNAGCLHNLT